MTIMGKKSLEVVGEEGTYGSRMHKILGETIENV